MNGSERTILSVAQFLEDLGLRQHSAVFEKEAVDFETLCELDDDDLRSIGLPLGHRKKILKAISDGLKPLDNEETGPEYRRVTVLFCDLVNSTHLSQSMSTEDLRDLLASFQKASVLAIERHGGHVAKYLGDGLMAYFGYPRSHEDDAVRAVETALDVLEAIGDIETPEGSKLEVRMGIHTGRVVAGEMGAGRTREKLSVAARLDA